MDVNIVRDKKLTNMRSSTADVFERLNVAKPMTLEEALDFIRDDECVEVTPEAVRIRKVILEQNQRQKAAARNKHRG
jgi:GTP-binding protein